MSWIYLALAIGCELFATLSLRASDGLRRRRWLVPVVVGYAGAFALLGMALQAGMAVGVAYAIWAATGIALVALLARAIWNEPLTRRMILGIVLVIAGVVLVETGAH
ncbi:multidrug efflux SMR transporter [Zhihengliuella sp.]|uniref:DMT family transporter n=1 Tax=Zhihengliuella sp. TaxID=1954483 RepID=UPI00281275AF|nr:multidrug efflux SMR transporter [Zhihengliuella sp.]